MEPTKPVDGNKVEGPFDEYRKRHVQYVKAIRMFADFFVVNNKSPHKQFGKAGDWMYFGPAGERYIATDEEFNRVWEPVAVPEFVALRPDAEPRLLWPGTKVQSVKVVQDGDRLGISQRGLENVTDVGIHAPPETGDAVTGPGKTVEKAKS